MARNGQAQSRIYIRNIDEIQNLFGKQDEYLRMIADALDVSITDRDNELCVEGQPEDVDRAERVIKELLGILRAGHDVRLPDVRYALELLKEDKEDHLPGLHSDVIVRTARGKSIKPRTIAQKRYVDAIRKCPLVFGIGPAGTGKTYLAMAMAVSALKEKSISRIILTRPAVEAGEKLGFLPGDLQEKVDPYLRPLYDALYDLLGTETYERYMERGIIEVAPLAYMRGRTLDDCFVILDEAQNTTSSQMKMFLTRLGFGSRAVVTGDITQVDLPEGQFSGLEETRRILSGIDQIAFIFLTDKDVVRHPLVQKIIKAYEQDEERKLAKE